MIRVEHLTKYYGDVMALNDLSFEIDEGHVYGFLGANGAGKSTTMNIMTGCLSATDGKVSIDGYDIFEKPENAKKLMGYLPELPPLYMNETPAEYLRFVGEAKGLKGAELKRQVEEVMEQTNIGGIKNRLISALSKGYRQRVGIAQALLGNPKVIILDEPTVGLDPIQIIEIRDLIGQLGENHTVILSSHILSEVSAVCDHIMIISGGKLIASDSPEGLQRLIQSSLVLEATVKASLAELQTVLDTIEAVTGAEEKPCSMPDCVTVLIRTKDNTDIREELSMKLYEKKLPIMGMNLQEHSLEDIFLELTEKGEEVLESKKESGSDTGCKDGEIPEGINADLKEETAEVEEGKHESNL